MEESAKATGLQFAAIFYDYAAAAANTTTTEVVTTAATTTTTASASSWKLIKRQCRFAWFWLRLRLI